MSTPITYTTQKLQNLVASVIEKELDWGDIETIYATVDCLASHISDPTTLKKLIDFYDNMLKTQYHNEE